MTTTTEISSEDCGNKPPLSPFSVGARAFFSGVMIPTSTIGIYEIMGGDNPRVVHFILAASALVALSTGISIMVHECRRDLAREDRVAAKLSSISSPPQP
jgi:hypothetical protein